MAAFRSRRALRRRWSAGCGPVSRQSHSGPREGKLSSAPCLDPPPAGGAHPPVAGRHVHRPPRRHPGGATRWRHQRQRQHRRRGAAHALGSRCLPGLGQTADAGEGRCWGPKSLQAQAEYSSQLVGDQEGASQPAEAVAPPQTVIPALPPVQTRCGPRWRRAAAPCRCRSSTAASRPTALPRARWVRSAGRPKAPAESLSRAWAEHRPVLGRALCVHGPVTLPAHQPSRPAGRL